MIPQIGIVLSKRKRQFNALGGRYRHRRRPYVFGAGLHEITGRFPCFPGNRAKIADER